MGWGSEQGSCVQAAKFQNYSAQRLFPPLSTSVQCPGRSCDDASTDMACETGAFSLSWLTGGHATGTHVGVRERKLCSSCEIPELHGSASVFAIVDDCTVSKANSARA